MIISTKNKILIGLFTIASVIILALGLMLYTFSGKVSNTSSFSSKSVSEITTAKAEVPTETGDGHFNIFSILNRFLAN